jgi:fructose-1,6-bisphosphatase/inositol monophosphatase family enzyme
MQSAYKKYSSVATKHSSEAKTTAKINAREEQCALDLRVHVASSMHMCYVCCGSISRWILALGVSKILTLIERMTLGDGAIF